MLSNYDPTIFHNLSSIFTARDGVPVHAPLLPQLGDVIHEHDLQHDIGISLLHKHFDLLPNEQLIEKLYDNRILIKPAMSGKDRRILPYMWKLEFDHSVYQWKWFPLEFVYVDEQPEACNQTEQLENETAFLNQMTSKLVELNLTGIFGISTLHRNILKPTSDQIVLETTDEINRVLTLRVEPKSEVEMDKTVQTLWMFQKTGVPKSGVECVGYCRHCKHCKHD